MPDFYVVLVTGRYSINGFAIFCLTCRAERGLTFITPRNLAGVTVRCPNGHTWADERVYPGEIRRLSGTVSQGGC